MSIKKSTKVRKPFIYALVLVVCFTGGVLLFNEGGNRALDDITVMCNVYQGFELDGNEYLCKLLPTGIQS